MVILYLVFLLDKYKMDPFNPSMVPFIKSTFQDHPNLLNLKFRNSKLFKITF